MLEHDIDIALAGNVPDGLAELARLLHPIVVLGRVDGRHLPPAIEVLAVDHALGAEAEHVIALGLVRDHADRVRARSGTKLHTENTETARAAPYENIVA